MVITSNAYSRKWGHACSMTQKGQKGPVKGHICGFLPLIFAIQIEGMYNVIPPSPKKHVFLEFLLENKAFCSTKKELHADTAHNKWLK